MTTRRWLGIVARVAWAITVTVVIAELLMRLGTYATWRVGLLRWPELATKIDFTNLTFFPRYNKEILLGPVGAYPAPIWPPDGPITWTTYDALPKDAFRSPPAEDATKPGVVRIAFFGGSTTWTGYPEEVGREFAERVGKDRVEALNLGVPSGTSWTSLVVMRNYVPRWRPHIAVVYQGFNDQANYAARALALLTEVDGSELVLAPPVSRGLWSLVEPAVAPRPWTRFHDIVEEGRYGVPEDAWWSMARLAWSQGMTLVLTTFAAPDYDTIPSSDRAFFDAEFRYVFPWAGGLDAYISRLAVENARIKDFTAVADVAMIDVAAAIHGGRDIYKDNCHLDEEGRARHAKVVAEGLEARVRSLLEAGAPAPAAPVAVAARAPVPSSPPAVTDGCVRGPCPAGACLVKAGRTRLGYAPADQARFAEAFHADLGMPRNWYADPRAVEEWEHGAFCLDQYERSRADRAACVAAGACPPYVEAPDADLPAALPTVEEARMLCTFFGGRIPDEREWEAGARGDDGRLLPWGDGWSGAEANLCGRECPLGRSSSPDDGAAGPAPRGRFSGTSPTGLRDVAGNLAEWVDACASPPCTAWLRGGSTLSPAGLLWRRPPDGLGDAAPRLRGVRCAFDVQEAGEG